MLARKMSLLTLLFSSCYRDEVSGRKGGRGKRHYWEFGDVGSRIGSGTEKWEDVVKARVGDRAE